MLKQSIAALGLVAASPFVAAEAADTYAFDPTHTYVGFAIDHLGFSIARGEFKAFEGSLVLDEENPANSSANFTITVDSVDTRSVDLDKHLKTDDFFAAETYPTITFSSTKVERIGEDKATVFGDLTIRGVTKPVSLDVMLRKLAVNPISKKKTAGFAATTTIDRTDFGVSAYAGPVGTDVSIQIDAEAVLAD